MSQRALFLVPLAFACTNDPTLTDTGAPEPAWDQAVAGEIYTLVTDPEGENVHSLVTAASGDLYISLTSPPSHTSDDIARVVPETGELTRIAHALPFPEGIDQGPDGALYTACWNDRSVHRVTEAGDSGPVSTGRDFPSNVHFGPDGAMYINNWESNTLDRVVNGERTRFSSHDEYNGVHGMTHADDGQMYAANFVDGKVFSVDEDGSATLLTQLPYSSMLGHLVWLDGHLYATAIDLNQVFRIATDGTATLFAGTGAQGDADGPAEQAQFDTPNGLEADPERHVLYVAMGPTIKVLPLVLPE